MKKRDYASLLNRLQAVGPTQLVAECGGYPIHAIELGSGTEARILLTAGLHGDEPAGPEAAVRFAEGLSPRLAQRCQFMILPCLNPHGYVHDTRENEAGVDCNREFGGDAVPLVVQVKALLSGRRFDCALDFHEDWEASGFYCYEAQRDEQWLGPTIVEQVREVMPIDGEAGESDKVIAEGVFLIDPEWGEAGLAPYLYAHHTDHALISETPSEWPLGVRAEAHLRTLGVVLQRRLGE